MKQEPQSNIINYGLPANMYTKTEAFDQHLFLSKSEAAMHYGPHYHRQRSFINRWIWTFISNNVACYISIKLHAGQTERQHQFHQIR